VDFVKNKKEKKEEIMGVINEALPNTLFRVITTDGGDVLAFLSGKMRLHRIRIVVGDKVVMEKDKYGGKARIVKRL